MRLIRLALQSMRHYWRLNLCLAAGVFLASAVLTGSLVVGDSVRETLRRAGELRVGKVSHVIFGGERFFTDALAGKVRAELDGVTVSSVFLAEGAVIAAGGTARANAVQILGIDGEFGKLAPGGGGSVPDENFVGVNEALARHLNVKVGDSLIARMEMPSALSKDAPLSGSTDSTVTIRKKITHLVPDAAFGRFSLKAEQTPPLNLFLPLGSLRERLEVEGHANLMLVGGGASGDVLAAAIEQHWDLADAALKLRQLEHGGGAEIFSERVFVSETEEAALSATVENADAVLTYMVNDLAANGKSVPYSFVASVGAAAMEKVHPGVRPGEMVVNEWLASGKTGLGLNPGDEVTLKYFVVSDGRQMDEHSATFVVKAILPMDSSVVNAQWTPEFPGISDAENCRDWDAGFEIPEGRVRDIDEEYWDDHKATPKAFVLLEDGQKIWSNRFGRVTALRFEDPDIDVEKLRTHLSFFDIGFHRRALGDEAQQAVSKSLDFGALFASLGMFLITAALILVSLLFLFGLEQRSPQAGLLMAMGFRAREVRVLFLWEAAIIALLAASAGAFGGVLYTKAALWGLSGVWQDAVARLDFAYHSRTISLVMGVGIVFVAAVVTVWIAARRVSKLQPKNLLAGGGIESALPEEKRKRHALWCVIGGVLGGGTLLVAARGQQGEVLAGMFFGAGTLLMIAGLGALTLLLRRLAARRAEAATMGALSARNATRRRGRSLAVAAVMACGVFLVTAVNSFRLLGVEDPADPASGTGGFRYVGESTLPVFEDLNADAARKLYGLDEIPKAELDIVQIRVRADGEEASCLNLNSVAQPQLLGLKPEALAGRGAFSFAGTLKGLEFDASPWELLGADLGEGVVAGIADKASAMWAMHKKLGDEIIYTDGRGRELRVRLVAYLANSILQGSAIISEDHFKDAFPAAGGYRMFLVDSANEEAVGEMTRMLEDKGLAVTESAVRLAGFSEVQNTYITIFSTLGGLGVLLGTIGVGLVIGRNVMERRSELAAMQAMGFERRMLCRMVVGEHWLLIVAGVVIGGFAALVAVIPNLGETGGGGLPWIVRGALPAAILVCGFVFCWLAAKWTLRGDLMEALRTE